MPAIDFKKQMRSLYAPPTADFVEAVVPDMNFLMIDGEGDPHRAPQYPQAVEALYALSYALKFASKRQLGQDYVVLPLEGLWSAADITAYRRAVRDEWQWTMMIMQPDWISPQLVEETTIEVRRKKRPVGLDLVRLERLEEGRCVQIMHIGSYADEAPTLRRLHEQYMPANNLDFNGRHHEIYLGDPRKTAPERLKTILRQPVKPRHGE